MAVSKFKQAVFIDNEPYILKSYLRSVTDDLVARFGSPAQGDTNLDLLKSESQKGFRGGMFQKEFDDPEMAMQISNAYYNELDNNLYFTPKYKVADSGINMNNFGVTAWCFFQGSLYLAYQDNGDFNRLVRYELATGTFTGVSLPDYIDTGTKDSIGSLTVFNRLIYINGNNPTVSMGSFHMTRYNGQSGGSEGFADLNNSLDNYDKAVVWRGGFYAGAGDVFRLLTNISSGTSMNETTLGDSGNLSNQYGGLQDILVFNDQIYILKTVGIFRYDGVAITPVLFFPNEQSSDAFKFTAVFNGRMYYTVGSKIYEFDGVNITMIEDLTDGFQIRDMTASDDRLWITTQAQAGFPGLEFEDEPVGVNTHQLFCYDGRGFFLYRQLPVAFGAGYENVKVSVIPVQNKIFLVVPDISLDGGGEPVGGAFNLLTIDLSNEFSDQDVGHDGTNNTEDGFLVVSSDIENGYPSVEKTLNGVMVDYEGFTNGESYFLMDAQTYRNGVWSSWSTVFDSRHVQAGGADPDYYLYNQSTVSTPHLATEPQVYEKLRYRIIGVIDTGSTDPVTTVPRIKKLALRYALQPRLRRRWLLTVQIQGVDNRSLNTPELSDGALEVRTASFLRRVLYDAWQNRKPVLLYDADFTEIKDVSPDIILQGTDFIFPGDFIAMQDTGTEDTPWLNRRVGSATQDELNDETTITLDDFGFRIGIGGANAPATAGVGAQVRHSHAVYITRLENERYIMDPNSTNELNDHSDFESDIVVELTEV